jgi:hypothetical protein
VREERLSKRLLGEAALLMWQGFQVQEVVLTDFDLLLLAHLLQE